MRTAFIQELMLQARVHPDLFLVVGDLGFSVVEPFAAEFPDRFLNVGVAEQNMTGVAAGLASEGYHVFTYSIANFPTLRCLEQIRNDICYHNLPVTVVAVGAGFAYGNLGYSHHAVQDLGIMRTLPNMTVLSPADPGEASECVQQLAAYPRPSYLRIGKAGETALHAQRGLDRGPLEIVAMPEAQRAVVATGSILAVALDGARSFTQQTGERVAVYSCPWLKPTTAAFFAPLWRHRRLVSIEEHIGCGGLGDLLRTHKPEGLSLHSLCAEEDRCTFVGSQQLLRNRHGLTAERVVSMLQVVPC